MTISSKWSRKRPDTTLTDVRKFGEECQRRWGITPLQIFLHKDEGHWLNGQPEAEDKENFQVGNRWFKPNYHAHVVFDWMNHETGKNRKLNDEDMAIMNQELEAKDKEISRLNTILEKAFNWFPLLKEMLRMEKLCYVIGFTKGMVDSLLYKREAIRCSGKIYSEEYRRRFETKNATFKIEQSPVDGNKLMLTINRQPIGEWFKEQWEKLRQGLRQSVEEPRKSRGFRM